MKQGSFYFTLNILFYAMIAGVILFALVAAYLVTSGQFQTNESLGELMIPIAGVLAASNIFISDMLFKNQMKRIHESQPLYSRQSTYRGGFILKMALLEGAALFAIVTYLLTGSSIAMIAAAVVWGWMAINRPSLDSMKKYLHLSSEEEVEMFG